MATPLIIKKKIDKTHEDYMCVLLEQAYPQHEISREYKFHIPAEGEKQRRWRFDAAIPAIMTAWECEGGSWSGGRHVTPQGFEKDLEKYNTATMQGWKVYRLVPRMLNLGWIERISKNARN